MLEVKCPNCGTSFVVGDEKNGCKCNPKEMNGTAYLVPETIRNENIPNGKGDVKMTKSEMRVEALKNAGFDVNKLFDVLKDKGIDLDSLVSPDKTEQMISASGYVNNSKLHRRWVMAQTFSMFSNPNGWTAALSRFAYGYCIEQMIEEVRVIGKIEQEDTREFQVRSSFFTKEVVYKVMKDYLMDRLQYLMNLKLKHCKGQPYVTVKGVDIFTTDIPKVLHWPLRMKIENLKTAKSYTELYEKLMDIKKSTVVTHNGTIKLFTKLPWNTAKSQTWIDAYKGSGAYYTAKNMIQFHNCKVYMYGYEMTTSRSLEILEEKRLEYQGEGWRLHAFLKKLIKDNHFDFRKRMDEIYSNK